jgi:hypothetical protein
VARFSSPSIVDGSDPFITDGYDNSISNRTTFPLTGGFFSLNSEHPSWTGTLALLTRSVNINKLFGQLVYPKADPATFQDFSSIVPFFQLTGEGIFCLNLDLSKTNASVTDGQNVTLEVRLFETYL